MNDLIRNNQDVLAEQFVLNDIRVSQTSYEAILKIKRWKFIVKIPGIGNRIRKEADVSIQKTLLSYVSNSFVLIEEGYFFTPSQN